MIRPPVIWRNVKGANATNHLWFIEIEPEAGFNVLAEEVAEWQYKAVLFIPIGLAMGAALAFAGYQVAGWFACVLAGIVGLFAGAVVGHNLRSGTRGLEYWGNAANVAAGGDIEQEARALFVYRQFGRAVPVETIKAEIGRRMPRALVWLHNNEAALLKVYEARP